MELLVATNALAALAQDTRLRAFRLLVQAGRFGLAAGNIADALGVPANTMSFHLSQLAGAGLVRQRRAGRTIIYVADFDRMGELVGFLTENCCGVGWSACESAGGGKTNPVGRRSMTDEARPYNVLFLCTGNSARSVMAEAALRRWSAGRFNAFSAGSHPKGVVHPLTLDTLRLYNHDVSTFRSKSWDEFAAPDSPPLDFVFTVCDNAAGEVCPIWPGQPMTAHWGVEDPAAFEGPHDKAMKVFKHAYLELENRIKIFASLRMEALDRLSLQGKLDDIGRARSEMAVEA